jgi:predicted GNAT superfamily acetyltransferase
MIRPMQSADFSAVLALNLESERFLSPMTPQHLAHLHAQAAYARVGQAEDGTVAAFLLAFREGADYASPNYQWFAQRHAQFLYIDRIVVSGSQQGQGWGPRLYQDLFAMAREQGLAAVSCEFDIDPPNEVSRRFHKRFGFQEVGRQWVAGGKKQVSLQQAPVLS